jgi:hypothetical protein
MKTMNLSLAAVAAALLAASATTHAVPIRLDTAPYISPTTTVPGNPPNQGDGTVKNWLQALINAYNAVNDPDLPAVQNAPAVSYEETQSKITKVEIPVAGYTYLTIHWGGKMSSDHSQAWYLGGDLTTLELVSPTGKGLSGYRLWNPVPVTRVPDGGSTLTLLGIALLGVGAWARRAQNRVG